MQTITRLLSIVLVAAFTGCTTVELAAPLTLPSAVCLVGKKNPSVFRYAALLKDGVNQFATGNDLSPLAFQTALNGVRVPGVDPVIVNSIYGGTVLAYTAVHKRYVNTPEAESKLRASLAAISAGLRGGIDQCAPQEAPGGARSFSGPVAAADVQELADAIERQLKAGK